jgi:hypothetical protein
MLNEALDFVKLYIDLLNQSLEQVGSLTPDRIRHALSVAYTKYNLWKKHK